VSVSPRNSNVVRSSTSELKTSYYVHIKALNALALQNDTGHHHNSLTAYHTLCRNLTTMVDGGGDAIFSIKEPEIHFKPSEKREDSIHRTLALSSDHGVVVMDEEMKSLILDAATGDAVLLMSRLDGTDMQLNEIAHKTDMRFDEIANAVRQTDMQLNEIANSARQTDQRLDGMEKTMDALQVLLREEFQRMRRLQEASQSHQEDHGRMAVVTGALITIYMLLALWM